MGAQVRVLLLTDRPSVDAFVSEHGRRSLPGLILDRIPLDADKLSQRLNLIQRASAAMVDVGSNPDMGVRAAAQLRSLRPDLHIVVVVCCSRPTLMSHVQELVELGVDDILDAAVQPEELMTSLRELGSPRRETRIRLERPYELSLSPLGPVTGHRQLLELVASGFTDDEIGAELQLGARAVRKRLERVRTVLGVRNRQELAAWAGAHGFYSRRNPRTGGSAAA
jgi:DNA-binding NarL/FixJ family response regulator